MVNTRFPLRRGKKEEAKGENFFFFLLSFLNAVLQSPALEEFKLMSGVLKKHRLLGLYVSSHLVSIFIYFKDKTFSHLKVKRTVQSLVQGGGGKMKLNIIVLW